MSNLFHLAIIGAGYIGTNAALFFENLGFSVTLATRKESQRDELKQFATHVYLIEDENDFTDLFQEMDAILVCVAPTKQTDSYETTYLKTVKKITASKHGKPLHLIYLSSTSLYGNQEGKTVTEDTSLPTNVSSQTKILQETEKELRENLPSNVSLTLLRLGEIVGPGRELFQRWKKGNHFPGTGENIVNISPLDDILHGIHFCLTKKRTGIYNLVSDFHPTRKELYEKIAQKNNLPSPIWDINEKTVHGGNKQVSSEKLKEEGFQFVDIDSWFQEM